MIGLFGGTFDPPHYGHLVSAQEAIEQLELEQVWFLPAGQPPHKRGVPVSPLIDRWKMTELAIGGDSRFHLSDADCGERDPSYTVDLLARLRHDLGSNRDLFFIVGMDSLRDLATWHQPARVLELAVLVAVTRPGHQVPDLAKLDRAVPGTLERVRLLETPGVDLSSTDLRARVAAGRSLRYLVPESVLDYISTSGLYLSAC